MVYPYISHVEQQYRAAPDEYLYDEKVEPSNILHVTHITAYHDTPTDADNIEIGLSDGISHHKLAHRQMSEDFEAIGRKVDIHVPPGWGVYAYFSTAAAGDDNELTVCGILYTVEEWKKMFGGGSS